MARKGLLVYLGNGQMRAPSLSLDNTATGLVGNPVGRRRLTSHPSHAHARGPPPGLDPDDMLLDIDPSDLALVRASSGKLPLSRASSEANPLRTSSLRGSEGASASPPAPRSLSSPPLL